MGDIVFVHLFNDRSGSPKVLSKVVHAMYERGHKVEVLTSSHDNGFLDGLPGRRRYIFYRRSENKVLTLFFYIVSQVCLFFYCLMYARRDVLFFVNTMMPFGAALAAKLMGKPVIYHVHETSLRPKLLKFFLRAVIEFTASKVIFVSRYLQGVESFKSMPQFVVHNALDFVSVGSAVTLPKVPFNVLMVCSLKVYKGVMEFFRIAERLSARADISFTLVLNADDFEINDFFSSVSIPENILLVSRQSDIDPFYERASILLNLSRPDEWIETFGLTILEGMAHGLPIIAPPVGGPAEIVTDGEEGYLISCYEIERIASAVERLADNAILYDKLSSGALRRARDYELTVFNKKIADIIGI